MLKKHNQSGLTNLDARLKFLCFLLLKYKWSGLYSGIFLFLLLLPARHSLAQSGSFVCGNGQLTNGITVGHPNPTPTASCNGASDIYNSFFKVKESFKPSGTIKPETVIKKVKLRFVIADPQTAQKNNFKNNSTDIAVLQSIVDRLNYINQHPAAPTAAPAGCTTCSPVSDNRIRYEMAGVSFFNSRCFYQTADASPDFTNEVVSGEKELNIFLAYYPLGGPDAWAGLTKSQNNIAKFDFYSDPNKDYIIMANEYQVYMEQGTVNNIANGIHHELFHEYGSWHLSGNGAESCNDTAADYLGDIFGFGANKVCLLPAGSNSNDVMMGGTYASYNQLEIMHRELFLGRMHKYAYPTESPTAHTWVVNSNQTWDFPIRMFQTIRVMPGATLTIKCEVQMPENSNIIVELGGRLILDGGTVTAYNIREAWGGIQVKGNQSKVASAQYQGVLEMKNGSVIENAWEGVWNYSPENYFTQGGGGIILAKDSKFYNCNKAVDVGGYETYSSIYNGVSQCSFQKMTFEIDQYSPFFTSYQQNGYEYFTADRQKAGLLIQNCIFKNDISYSYQWTGRRGRAIRISESGANIIGNSFDGFVFGVKTENYTGTSRSTMIRGNKFTRISENIMVATSGYTNVLGNNISQIINSDTGTNGNPKYFPGSAIFLDNAKGVYVGCGNIIDGKLDSNNRAYPKSIARDTQYRRGIVIQDSKTFGGTVIDNIVNNIAVGTQTQRDNPLLNIFCNNYYKNQTAWQINPQSQNGFSLHDQGTGCATFQTRAGNVFNTNARDIVNYINYNWRYFALGGNPLQVPFNNINFIPTNCANLGSTDPNSQCDGAHQLPRYYICNQVFMTGPIHTGLIRDYYGLVNTGAKWSADANILFHDIVVGYQDLDDEPGLISFLETEQDDNARRILIPLYMENFQYNNMHAAIAALELGGEEREGYNSYYTILANMYKAGNTIYTLGEDDWNTITQLAQSSLEVAPYAKGLLDITGREEWYHIIEEPGGELMAYGAKATKAVPPQSRLYTAAPNPAKNETVIRIAISNEDKAKNPVLVITAATGRRMATYRLSSTDNYVDINTRQYAAGIYFYALQLNGHTTDTKKFVVIK